jgi:hypothetical protein
MRTASLLLALAQFPVPAVYAADDTGSQAASAAIREVVAGKTCIGDDVLIFGKSLVGTTGTYERVGRPPGRYRIGDGTILILRGKDLHSHIATVSIPDHMLYMSTSKYLCGP